MITEEDIIEAEEREKLLAESYHKGIMDFVKWTSTVAIAAILWVGNAVTSITGLPRILAIVGLGFLVVSLATAILAVKRVLTAWAAEWVLAKEDYTLCLLKKIKAIEPSKVTQEKEDEQIQRLIKANDATKPFARPTGFSTWISCHIALLLVGLLLYVFAQVWSVL
jgi:hypothetical protein